MVPKIISLLLLLIGLLPEAYCQILTFPYDTSATNINGNVSSQEWQHAAEVKIPINATDTVRVLYKHDMNAMYFAFIGKLESANALFPEVLLDPQNQRTSNWITGQWWFHVSATDCENNGGYGIYNNCLAVQPGWAGAPNMATGMPYTDTIEIRIPFSKTGFNPATHDTVGISMMVTNTMTIYKLFPVVADRNIPSTWAQAVFSKILASVTDDKGARVNVHIAPNPARDHLSIDCGKGFTYELYDLTGKYLERGSARSGKTVLKLAHLAPSTYVLKLAFDNGASEVLKFHKE